MARPPSKLESYVPDFLEDSPFLPFGNTDDNVVFKRTVKTQWLSISQILRHRYAKRIRSIVGICIVLWCAIHYFIIRRYFSGPRCLQARPVSTPQLYPPSADFHWSQVAYAQYATNTDYLCNSIMIFEALQRLHSQPDRILLYPSSFRTDDNTVESKLLNKAKSEYGVKIVPIEVLKKEGSSYRKST